MTQQNNVHDVGVPGWYPGTTMLGSCGHAGQLGYQLGATLTPQSVFPRMNPQLQGGYTPKESPDMPRLLTWAISVPYRPMVTAMGIQGGSTTTFLGMPLPTTPYL